MSMMNIIITFVATSFATVEDLISTIVSAIATLNVGETLDIHLYDDHGGHGPLWYSSWGHFTDAEVPDTVRSACWSDSWNNWLDYFSDLYLTRKEDGTIDIYDYEE